MSEGKGEAMDPASLEDRVDRVERMLERVVEVINASTSGMLIHLNPEFQLADDHCHFVFIFHFFYQIE